MNLLVSQGMLHASKEPPFMKKISYRKRPEPHVSRVVVKAGLNCPNRGDPKAKKVSAGQIQRALGRDVPEENPPLLRSSVVPLSTVCLVADVVLEAVTNLLRLGLVVVWWRLIRPPAR